MLLVGDRGLYELASWFWLQSTDASSNFQQSSLKLRSRSFFRDPPFIDAPSHYSGLYSSSPVIQPEAGQGKDGAIRPEWAFGLLIIEVIYLLLRTLPEYWWVVAGIFIFAINIVLANLAPILLMPLFFKFTPLADEYRELSERLVRLSERAGTRVRGVFQIDMSRRTKTANAALTGWKAAPDHPG
jgi:hypothetical protein